MEKYTINSLEDFFAALQIDKAPQDSELAAAVDVLKCKSKMPVEALNVLKRGCSVLLGVVRELQAVNKAVEDDPAIHAFGPEAFVGLTFKRQQDLNALREKVRETFVDAQAWLQVMEKVVSSVEV